jgi:hypothetical protein
MPHDYLHNIYNFDNYEYLNPSQNRYGNLELMTAATTQVVTTAELKAQLRIDTSDEDTLLATYISAATQMAEHYCNRHFINARYELFFYEDLPSTFSLYFPDVTMDFGQAANTDDGLLYLSDATDNTYNILGFGNYILKNSNPYIFCKSSIFVEPTGIVPMEGMDGDNKSRWIFRFKTGMGASASNIPDAIKQAIKLIASDMYYFREDRKRAFPMASEILLQPYKCYL